jgi:RNA polymerase sigma-70 factor (ECF subfamily)
MRGAFTNARVAELYKKFGPAIYCRCRRLLGDAALAEDATQEVFIRVARHLDSTHDSAEAVAWIHRIAINYCLNEIRGRKRRVRIANALPEATVGNGGEDSVVNRELVRRIVQRTPARLFEAAYLYHVDGLSHEEVAGVMGHSRRTVINHIAEFGRRARKFLLRTQ